MEQVEVAMQAFKDKANLLWATVLTVLSRLFGKAAPILGFFIILNIVDTYYGRRKAKHTGTLSSEVGAKGIEKKVSYWVIIGLAFGTAHILRGVLEPVLGIDLGFLMLIGWFTLAVYVLNELTSIVENMLVLGYDVPEIFVKGLAAARSAVDAAGNKIVPHNEENEKQKEEGNE